MKMAHSGAGSGGRRLLLLAAMAGVLLIALVLVGCGSASYRLVWERMFGGEGWAAASAITTTGNGLVVAGRTTSKKKQNIPKGWILRLDGTGKPLWHTSVAGAKIDVLWNLAVLPDGGIIAAGRSEFEGDRGVDALLVRVSAKGKLLWRKRFGIGRFDVFNDVAIATDGGVAVVGQTDAGTQSKGWLLRLDQDGELVWLRVFDSLSGHGIARIMALADGFVVIGGGQAEGKSWQGWVARLDDKGNIIWEAELGGPEIEHLHGLAALPNGDIIVAGQTTSAGAGGSDAWILRLSKDGKVKWRRTFGGKQYDLAKSAVRLTDGRLAFTVWFDGAYAKDDKAGIGKIGVLVLDEDGKELWRHLFPERKRNIEGLAALKDGGFALAGFTEGGYGKAWILRFGR